MGAHFYRQVDFSDLKVVVSELPECQKLCRLPPGHDITFQNSKELVDEVAYRVRTVKKYAVKSPRFLERFFWVFLQNEDLGHFFDGKHKNP